MEVREAELVEDLSSFFYLWQNFVEEQEKKGSYISATPKTLDFYKGLYSAYLDKEAYPDYKSAVLIASDFVAVGDKPPRQIDIGCLMWGSVVLPYDTKFSHLASGWGTYVAPNFRRSGAASALRERASELLTEQGVDAVIGSVLLGDDPALASATDWQMFAKQGILNL